jgi:uncharacterized protein
LPYIIETWDKPNHQSLRQSTRPEHLVFLADNAAKLIACGAKLHDDGTDIGGGVYIVDTEDRAEAEALIAADPFTKVDLFERVLVTRWRKAYVDGKCLLPGA